LTAVGPILGGYLTQWTWRAIFWVNIPVENIVLAIAMLTFIPVFFFASEYAQIALGKTPSEAGLYILYFFIGFLRAGVQEEVDPAATDPEAEGSPGMATVGS
jgi:MFS family permease